MSNVNISPQMNLPVPVVGTDPGPDWATNINACLTAIDSHNHSAGQGVQIPPAGLNINSDLPFGGNNATLMRSVNFSAQGSPLATAADIGCIYVSGVDLYYNDENGNQVRITQSGSVTGSTGTITGLPSGTASASFAAGTFTFQSATNTPATMAVGPLVIGAATTSPNTVTLAPNASQPSSYSLTFPLASPAASQFPVSDASGNLSWVSSTGTGNIVLATSAALTTPTLSTPSIATPSFTGSPTGTITASTYTPTVTPITNVTTSGNNPATYMRIGNVVTVFGTITIGPTAAGGATTVVSLSLPVSSTFTGTADASGLGQSENSLNLSPWIAASALSSVVLYSFSSGSTSSAKHHFSFSYQVI